jgi:hypothetical protein
MQLENKKYIVVENIFSDRVLTLLKPYARLLPTDKSSYDVWPAESTNNNTAVECFTCDVLGKDRTAIIDELYNNKLLPCYGEKWLRDCDIAIQKLPTGGFIPKHTDHCMFSLTVFLSEVKGGEFHWWDSDNNKHIVKSMFNRGVFSNTEEFKRGLPHEVTPVELSTRFTLQLFVFDKRQKTNDEKGVIWEIEE